MYLQQAGNGEVDPSLLGAFQAQNAPKHAEFLVSLRRKSCIEILSAETIPQDVRSRAIYGQIHEVEYPLFSDDVVRLIDQAHRSAENSYRFSSDKFEYMHQFAEIMIQSNLSALVARQQAIEWLREILPEEYHPVFDAETYLAVGDLDAQIEALVARGDQGMDPRRTLGTYAIAS